MKDENKLFVGNLSFSITSDQLAEMFGAVEGVEVSEANVISDRMTGQPRGFGFVKVTAPEMLQIAIDAMNGKEVDGRALAVNVARPQSNDRGGNRGGYQGNRGGGGGNFGRRY